LDYAEWLWDESNPNDLKEDGRNSTGLVRLFRDYTYAATVDEWGFPRKKRAAAFRQQKLNKYIEAGDYEQVIDLYRKEPSTVEEALTGGSEECPLYPEICHMRLRQLREGLDTNNQVIADYKPRWVEGNLQWKNGKINTEIIFVPVKGGKWHISQMPVHPNNVRIADMTMRDEMGQTKVIKAFVPNNGAFYRGGGDTYDHKFILGKGSKAGLAIKRRLYLPDESPSLEVNSDGDIMNPEEMMTNRFVCDYLARPQDPETMYMDFLMTLWFYGCPGLLELDRPGVAIWMAKHGYYGFIQKEPMTVTRLRRRNSRPLGVRSSGDLVSFYTEMLQIYIHKYWKAIDHPRLLKDWARFIPEKRTRFDLSVASGLAVLGERDNSYRPQNEEATTGWSSSPYSYKST
jgi:hypothetical protein